MLRNEPETLWLDPLSIIRMNHKTYSSAGLIATVAAVAFASIAARVSAAETNSFPVTIRVDAAKPTGPLRQIWRFFGADEPNYATMKDGQKLLADFGELRPKEVYFRTHNLFLLISHCL